MNEIETLIGQNVAALSMAIVFIWYLIGRDKQSREIQDLFTKTITNHLQHSLTTEVKLSKSLERMSNCINELIKQGKKKRR